EGLGAWVANLLRTRAPLTRGDLQQAALQAAREMRTLGTVAVGDVCTLLATAEILAEADLMGASFLEVVVADDEALEAARADAGVRARGPHGSAEVDVEIVPHSCYGTAAEGSVRLAGPGGVRTIHAAEHEDENAWLVRG